MCEVQIIYEKFMSEMCTEEGERRKMMVEKVNSSNIFVNTGEH
jgi:hypothetical protein